MPESEREREELRRAIEAERARYAAEQQSWPGEVVPHTHWQVLQDEGHRGYFTEEEVARSGEVFVPWDEAAEFARELYADPDTGLGIFFPEEMLSALSLLSEELAERVRVVLDESPDEAAARVEVFISGGDWLCGRRRVPRVSTSHHRKAQSPISALRLAGALGTGAVRKNGKDPRERIKESASA